MLLRSLKSANLFNDIFFNLMKKYRTNDCICCGHLFPFLFRNLQQSTEINTRNVWGEDVSLLKKLGQFVQSQEVFGINCTISTQELIVRKN